MVKPVQVLAVAAVLLSSACGIIPGTGFYAAEVVDRFIGTRYSNPNDPERNPVTGSFYGHGHKGGIWLYLTEREGPGTRHFIRYDYERCKYSLYVDENDIIRSWRDEGGNNHMNRCQVR